MIINSNKFGRFEILIDLESVKMASNFTWSINKLGNRNSEKVFFYARNYKAGLFHRYISNCPDTHEVDHINRNTLDNRTSNIRHVSPSQNRMNRGKQLNNKSGHIGVAWVKRFSKWMAHIRKDGVQKNLGYFDDINDAILARRNAEKIFFGEYRGSKISNQSLDRYLY